MPWFYPWEQPCFLAKIRFGLLLNLLSLVSASAAPFPPVPLFSAHLSLSHVRLSLPLRSFASLLPHPQTGSCSCILPCSAVPPHCELTSHRPPTVPPLPFKSQFFLLAPPLQATPFPQQEASPLSPAPGTGSAPIGGSPVRPAPPLPPHLCAPPPTCRVSLVDRPAVHLQRGITTTSRETDYVVLPIVNDCIGLFNGDVICPNIKFNSNFSLMLEESRGVKRVEWKLC